jgi:hypothetical protein
LRRATTRENELTAPVDLCLSGTRSGWVRSDAGRELRFDHLQGFAEEARQEW